MVQYASYDDLLTSLPTVEEVLDDHASELGHDLIAYRNHVYRVVNLCLAILGDSRVELEKIAVEPYVRLHRSLSRESRASTSRHEGGRTRSPRSRR